MDPPQLDVPQSLEEWVQIIMDFGLLFFGGSLLLCALAVIFLLVSSNTAERSQRPGNAEEADDAERAEKAESSDPATLDRSP